VIIAFGCTTTRKAEIPMALSPDQKAANKRLNAARSRAYTARGAEFRNIRTKGLAAIEQRLGPAIRSAMESMDAIIAERGVTDRDLLRQIRELEARRVALRSEADPALEAARTARDAASQEKRRAEQLFEAELGERFPDMTGDARFSEALWGASDFGKAASRAEYVLLEIEGPRRAEIGECVKAYIESCVENGFTDDPGEFVAARFSGEEEDMREAIVAWVAADLGSLDAGKLALYGISRKAADAFASLSAVGSGPAPR
jgi:hypothetical protein